MLSQNIREIYKYYCQIRIVSYIGYELKIRTDLIIYLNLQKNIKLNILKCIPYTRSVVNDDCNTYIMYIITYILRTRHDFIVDRSLFTCSIRLNYRTPAVKLRSVLQISCPLYNIIQWLISCGENLKGVCLDISGAKLVNTSIAILPMDQHRWRHMRNKYTIVSSKI